MKIVTLDIDSQPKIVGERGEQLTPRLTPDGYLQVKTKIGNKWQWRSIHRLVAQEFIPNPDNLETVDHIDGNKLNNAVSNLQWMSREDNIKKGLSRGCLAHNEEGFGYYFPSQASTKVMGFLQPLISKCIAGLRKTHGGFSWEAL